MRTRNFPNFIEAFLEYTQVMGAPTKFFTWSAVAGIAACLERRTWVVYNGSQVIYPNMYIMLIAESGIANKSTATQPIIGMLKEVPQVTFLSTQMSTASLISQFQNAGLEKRFEWEGTKYANSSLFSYSSEAASTIGDNKALGDIQVLLTDFYDCGTPNTWSLNGSWSKNLVSTGMQQVYNPCLNALYCSTPTWLLKSIGKDGIQGGFASRFIFVNQFERHLSNLEWLEEDEIPDKAKFVREKLVSDLRQISQLKGVYRVGKGFKDAYNHLLKERNKKVDLGGDMQSYYSRKMWHLLKLAQILTANETNDMIIKPESLIKAGEMLKALEPDMYRPFSSLEPSVPMFTRSVWEYCKDKPKVTRKELTVHFLDRLKHPKQLDDALTLLSNMQKMRLDTSSTPLSYLVIDPTPID